jgi:hypothetical protein
MNKHIAEPGHEISESLFEIGSFDLGVSVIMDIVYSKRAFSQPLDLSG